MTLPIDLIIKVKGRHARELAKQLSNPKHDRRRAKTSSEARKIFSKNNQE
ncbi:MAG: hypothetical protein ACE5IJ_04510 [Thermoplasmata archaeon]